MKVLVLPLFHFLTFAPTLLHPLALFLKNECDGDDSDWFLAMLLLMFSYVSAHLTIRLLLWAFSPATREHGTLVYDLVVIFVAMMLLFVTWIPLTSSTTCNGLPTTHYTSNLLWSQFVCIGAYIIISPCLFRKQGKDVQQNDHVQQVDLEVIRTEQPDNV
jgi:uncharacterized membrane protein